LTASDSDTSCRKFDTGVAQVEYVDYDMYIVEWMGSFDTGRAEGEVFRVESGGRIDGEPIKALMPPGNG
jgi:hypothetical protein